MEKFTTAEIEGGFIACGFTLRDAENVISAILDYLEVRAHVRRNRVALKRAAESREKVAARAAAKRERAAAIARAAQEEVDARRCMVARCLIKYAGFPVQEAVKASGLPRGTFFRYAGKIRAECQSTVYTPPVSH